MAKVKKMSISEFMSRDFNQEIRIKKVNRRNKTIIKVAGLTFIVLAAGTDISFAASSIDKGASAIYYKLANIGKWVIICKGAIDIIKSVGEGDMQKAQKNALMYLLIYALLLGLPWGMNEVDNLFKDISKS